MPGPVSSWGRTHRAESAVGGPGPSAQVCSQWKPGLGGSPAAPTAMITAGKQQPNLSVLVAVGLPVVVVQLDPIEENLRLGEGIREGSKERHGHKVEEAHLRGTLLLARKLGLEAPVRAIRRAAGRYCETHRVHSMPCATSRCTARANAQRMTGCDLRFRDPGLVSVAQERGRQIARLFLVALAVELLAKPRDPPEVHWLLCRQVRNVRYLLHVASARGGSVLTGSR